MNDNQEPSTSSSSGGAGPSGASSGTISLQSLDASKASGSYGGPVSTSGPTEHQTDQVLDLVPGLRDFLAHFKHKGDRSQGVQELSRVEKHRLAAVYHSLLEKIKDCIKLLGDTIVISSNEAHHFHNATGTNNRHAGTKFFPGATLIRKNAKAKFQKLMERIKRIPWRKVVWVLVNVGVFGGCVAGTVLTHGAGAPLFVLFIATVKWAERDIKEHRDQE